MERSWQTDCIISGNWVSAQQEAAGKPRPGERRPEAKQARQVCRDSKVEARSRLMLCHPVSQRECTGMLQSADVSLYLMARTQVRIWWWCFSLWVPSFLRCPSGSSQGSAKNLSGASQWPWMRWLEDLSCGGRWEGVLRVPLSFTLDEYAAPGKRE
jgi:hypothetical protein